METKSFKTTAVIGLTSGILYGDFGELHELAEWVAGHPIWTHEFADQKLHDRLREKVFGQHPVLRDIHVKGGCYNVDEEIELMERLFGKTLEIARGEHTPGPWRVDETNALGAYGVWTNYATVPGHDGAGYPSQICSVAMDLVGDNREQRDANARLIAAAPDLLDALITMEASHAAHGPCDGNNCSDCHDARDKARAVLGKLKAKRP